MDLAAELRVSVRCCTQRQAAFQPGEEKALDKTLFKRAEAYLRDHQAKVEQHAFKIRHIFALTGDICEQANQPFGVEATNVQSERK